MITPDEMWNRMYAFEGKIFSVAFQRKNPKFEKQRQPDGSIVKIEVAPAGEVREMLCRRRVRRYTKGVIPPAVRQAEDIRCNVATVWDIKQFQKMKKELLNSGISPARAMLRAGRGSYRRINLQGIVATSLPSLNRDG